MKRLLYLNVFSLFFLFLFSQGLFNCRNEKSAPDHASAADPYQRIPDAQARELLRKAIDRAGGLNRWNSIKTLRFKKYFALYEESGAIENKALQIHEYVFRPEEQINIEWEKDGVGQKMVFENGRVVKTIDGQPDTTIDQRSTINNVLSATFVISIPFKLLDQGVELSYAGPDTLEDGQVVEVIKAVYDPAEHENHSTPDVWHHYFSGDDYRQVGYLVQHADHFSYVRNLSFNTVDSFLFPKERKSYRVDSLRNILYLRAYYDYSDYSIQ